MGNNREKENLYDFIKDLSWEQHYPEGNEYLKKYIEDLRTWDCEDIRDIAHIPGCITHYVRDNCFFAEEWLPLLKEVEIPTAPIPHGVHLSWKIMDKRGFYLRNADGDIGYCEEAASRR